MKQLDTIYLIDDDEGINFLNRAIITRLKLANNIVSFKDPMVAFEALKKSISENKAPELILLDINMPLMDGWEFVNQYSKLDVTHSSVIVLLSSSIDPADEAKAQSIKHIAAFKSKPLSFDMAKDIVSEYC